MWHKQVPLKVSIVAWRLLKDRLPTRSNLHRRDIVPIEGDTCVSGCGHAETASHLFLHCDVFGSLWQHIRSWIGVSGVDPLTLTDHFLQFIHSTGSSKYRSSFLQLLCLLCVWLIWGERNNRIFNNVETPILQLLDKVKFHSLWWLKAKTLRLCMALIVGGRTLCGAWASTDHSFVLTLYDTFLVGVFS